MIRKYSQLKKADFLQIIPKNKTPAVFDNTEILKNPDRHELLQIPGARKYVDKCFAGFLLSSGGILVWDRNAALHQGIRDTLKLPNDVIPFQFYMDDNSVTITDNIRNSTWNDKRNQVANQIEASPALQDLGLTEEVHYYDEAIVGDWRDLEDEEVENDS